MNPQPSERRREAVAEINGEYVKIRHLFRLLSLAIATGFDSEPVFIVTPKLSRFDIDPLRLFSRCLPVLCDFLFGLVLRFLRRELVGFDVHRPAEELSLFILLVHAL